MFCVFAPAYILHRLLHSRTDCTHCAASATGTRAIMIFLLANHGSLLLTIFLMAKQAVNFVGIFCNVDTIATKNNVSSFFGAFFCGGIDKFTAIFLKCLVTMT